MAHNHPLLVRDLETSGIQYIRRSTCAFYFHDGQLDPSST